MQYPMCLLAIDGDCAAGPAKRYNLSFGHSDTPDFIPLDGSDFPLVKLYLENQLRRQTSSPFFVDPASDRFSELLNEHHALGNALIAIGIFHHKWHKRTTWVLWEMDDDYPINLWHGDFSASENKANPCLRKSPGYNSDGTLINEGEG